jgi:hypothetical protein
VSCEYKSGLPAKVLNPCRVYLSFRQKKFNNTIPSKSVQVIFLIVAYQCLFYEVAVFTKMSKSEKHPDHLVVLGESQLFETDHFL